MKKLISIMTAMIVTICTLSCVSRSAVTAEGNGDKAASAELIAGNMPDKPVSEFKTELVGDKIKIKTSPGGDFFGIMFLLITNDKFEFICSENTGECSLKPESNSKYLLMRPVGVPGSKGSFGYNVYHEYMMLIECHDNVVDIKEWDLGSSDISESDKSYYLALSIFEETDSFFVYGGINGTMTDRCPVWLILKGEGENCSFFDGNMAEFSHIYTVMGNIRGMTLPTPEDTQKSCKIVSVPLGDFTEEMLKDAVILGQREEIFFKTENGKTTKYNILFNNYAWLKEGQDPNDLETEVSCYIPNSFKSVAITNNDINLDGELNVADAVILSKYLHGKGGMNKVNAWLADVCTDGTIDVFDLCMLKKALISAEQTGG